VDDRFVQWCANNRASIPAGDYRIKKPVKIKSALKRPSKDKDYENSSQEWPEIRCQPQRWPLGSLFRGALLMKKSKVDIVKGIQNAFI